MNEINELEVINESENEQMKNVEEELKNEQSEKSSSSTNSSSSGSSTESSETSKSDGKIEESLEEPPVKRRRKRKRRPKKKKSAQSVTAYVPDEPFKARYKKLPVFLNSAIPKVHLRFNDDGSADENKSEYNYKPRIIKALLKNLSLNENFNDPENEEELDELQLTQEIPPVIQKIKPRIIKAIGY